MAAPGYRHSDYKQEKGRAPRRAPGLTTNGWRSEGETETELRQPLLALSRIAGERGGRAVLGGVAVADEAGRVLRVEKVEDFADQLDSVGAAELEGLGQAHVELRERVAAQRVHVADAGGEVERVTVAVEVDARPVGVRRAAAEAVDAGEVEAPRTAIETAHRHAMAR